MIELLAASFVGACLLPLSARLLRRGAGLLIALLPAGLLGGFVSMSPALERGWVIGRGHAWAPALGLDFTLRLDGFSFLFCLLITGIGTLVVIYAGGYMTDKSQAERSRFFTLILLFMTAMLGTVLAENLLVLLMFWEATSILSFLLIGFDSRSARARRAALMALQVTAFGGLLLLAAVLMIGQALGTYSMAEAIRQADVLAASRWGNPVVACLLVAAFTKSAQFPFHFWLPNAMQAPTPASAYLHSATMVKLGIYLLARFEPVFATTTWGRTLVITVGCVTMLLAAFQALRAENFKTALAHSTIASLGILTLLVGLDGPAATVAMVGFLMAHALYKAALFFCAGSVLHATGLHNLRAMGGLARFLPLTAIACIGASLSMAGIPPFMGFISKEFLFEAQLQSSWTLGPLAVALIVNAAMVGVAGVVTLRPFFLNQGKVEAIRHGESFALVAPPLVLALGGLVVSLEPGWITRAALRPAVAAVYGRPLDVDIAVWHGITPMLMLSLAVITVGALIVWLWHPIHRRLRRIDRQGRLRVERLWEASLRALIWVSRGTTAWFQHGDLRRYLVTVLMGTVALVTWSVVAGGAMPQPPGLDDLRPGPMIVAGVGLGGALAATQARSLPAAMISTGLTGFAVAITFLMNGAPDLALTQFAVEALLVVILTALLLAVPLRSPQTRTPGMRVRDAVLAGSIALLLFVALLDTTAGEPLQVASAFYGKMSYLAAYGHNVVNVILVDFRAFDTMIETIVVAVAAITARSLLMARHGARERYEPHAVHFAFHLAGRPLAWLLLAASLVILWRGHDLPGGGFTGGLVGALAFAIMSLAYGVERAEQTLRFAPLTVVAAGVILTVLSGLPGMMTGKPFLTHLWWQSAVAWLPKLSTTLIFDFGVYLVVLGAVLAFLFGLQRQVTR